MHQNFPCNLYNLTCTTISKYQWQSFQSGELFPKPLYFDFYIIQSWETFRTLDINLAYFPSFSQLLNNGQKKEKKKCIILKYGKLFYYLTNIVSYFITWQYRIC